MLYITLCHATLCYITLRYVTLRYATLRYVTLRYATLRYVTLRYATLTYVIRLYGLCTQKSQSGNVTISGTGRIAHLTTNVQNYFYSCQHKYFKQLS